MTKLALRLTVVAFLALGLFSGSVRAQKIAVVDVNAVVAAMPEYIAAQKRLDEMKAIYSDTIKMMQNTYAAKMDAYSKVGETATPEFKKKSQDDLAGVNDQFLKYRDSKFGQEGELAVLNLQLLKPIQDKLTTTLASYAKKEKLTAIFPKTATVYVDPALDLTTKFQDYLKAQAAK